MCNVDYLKLSWVLQEAARVEWVMVKIVYVAWGRWGVLEVIRQLG